MITAIVTFKIPQGTSREQWLEQIKPVSQNFRNVPGHIRKQFLFSENGTAGGTGADGVQVAVHVVGEGGEGHILDGTAGGVYLWESRAAAEACYAGPWRDNVRRIAGGDPDIVWFDTQIVVDNEKPEIRIAA